MLYVGTFINGGIGYFSVLKSFTYVICAYIHKWRNMRYFIYAKNRVQMLYVRTFINGGIEDIFLC